MHFMQLQKKEPTEDKYEPTVSISTKERDGKVLISVKDNGKGIPQKIVDKIFQPLLYYQTHRAGNRIGFIIEL